MYQFLFNETYRNVYYGCEMYSEDLYPSSERGSMYLGILYIVLFGIYEALYLPVLFAMFHTDIRKSCFKIMFYIGVIDVASIIINCGMTGYFCMIGAVYCTHPLTIYISGAIATALWCAACMGCVILAFNRCLEITSHNLAELLFHGRKTYLWLIPPTVYFLFCLFFTTPTIFNGYYCAYFSDPYLGMHEEPIQWYNDLQHTINNCSSFSILCCLYVYLCVILYKRSRVTVNGNNFLKIQLPVLMQAFLICLLNTLAAAIYVVIQFTSASLAIIVLAQMTWQGSQGAAPIIFLVFNKTIRKDCVQMVGLGKFFSSSSSVFYVGSRETTTARPLWRRIISFDCAGIKQYFSETLHRN